MKILKFAQRHRHVQESLDIIAKSLDDYKPDEICISFNGGKDCTAVLHLVHSAIEERLGPTDNGLNLVAFYAQLPRCFDEEESFVKQTVQRYKLNILQYSSDSLKKSLMQLKDDKPNIKAIFIGTRNDDLKSGVKMSAFAPTDADWPKFMRINPILNWSYDQVWKFIRELEIPYCDLYNQGYSSLGTKDNTTKNSSLLRFDNKGEPYYLPAWNLMESRDERLSRSSSISETNNNS